jgi:phosphoglycolate phosphatase
VIRNIIFDWSGTLVDDLPAVWKASNYAFERAGVPGISLERFRAEFQLPFAPFYERHLPHVPLPQLETWFHESFRQAQDSVVALPHAREFLEFCRRHGLRTFLLSAVHPEHFEIQQRVTGFGSFLDRPYLGVHDKARRIHEVLAENQLRAEETIFIGDMQHDVETARHGGIRSVAVLTGYNSLDQLRQSQPDLIVEHLSELQRHLEANDLRLAHAAPKPRHPIPTVGALIFDDAGRMLLVRTAKWSGLWGIPGGKIEWDEPAETALRRELREETGLEVDRIHFVTVQDAIQPPEFYRPAHFLLLNYTCRALPGQRVRLNSEAQDYRWVTRDEVGALPLNQPTRRLLELVLPA